MGSVNKAEIAAEKLKVLDEVLSERREDDQKRVLKVLKGKEQGLYLAARKYYARGSEKAYGYDQRHIDFSTLMALGLCDENADRDVVLPAVIFHDAGRYKTPQRVTEVDHASFTQRLLHMYEGQKLVEKNMETQGYSRYKIELASGIISVHDWAYVGLFDAEEELRQSNPVVDFDGTPFSLEHIYYELLQIAESGFLQLPEFQAYRDADRLNVPAAANKMRQNLRGG